MKKSTILAAALAVTGSLWACSFARADEQTQTSAAGHARKELPPHPDTYDDLIAKLAKRHGLPESLIHRIIVRESRYRPAARNRIYFGLMQITYATARSMGYKGPPKGLLDAETNLTYAVPYLANAYMVGGKSEDRAVAFYAAGYYFEARRQHKLDLLRTASSEPVIPEVAVAVVPPPPPPNPISLLFNALAGTPNPTPVGNPNPNPPPVETAAGASTEEAAPGTPAASDIASSTEAAPKEASAETALAPSADKETAPKKKHVAKKAAPQKTILASAKPITAVAPSPAPPPSQASSKPELK